MSKIPKKIGVVLSGGGLKSICSGVATFMVLDDLGLVPEAVCGSSGGAIASAMYASGMSGLEMKEKLVKLSLSDYYDPDYLGLIKAVLTGFSGWTGILKGNALVNYLTKVMPAHTFGGCKADCFIVTVNVSRGYKEVISGGNLAEVAAASASIPFVFKARRLNGDLHFDGGAVSNVPAYALSKKRPDLTHILISSTQDLDPLDHAHRDDLTAKFFTPYHMFRNWLEALAVEERMVHIDTGNIPHTNMEVKMNSVGFFEPQKVESGINSAVLFINDFLKKEWNIKGDDL